MRLKDGLMLRQVAGQYVIVPTGKRVQEITSVVYISSSAAYLWDYMKDHEFEKSDLVERILQHYTGVTKEQAAADVEQFLKMIDFPYTVGYGIYFMYQMTRMMVLLRGTPY